MVNELGLPREALVNVIVREDQALLPRGSTEIEAGDRLHILVRQPVRELVESLFERWREGPIGEAGGAGADASRAARPSSACAPGARSTATPAGPETIDGLAVTAHAAHPPRASRARSSSSRTGASRVTGDVVATGGARQLFRYCRDRIRRARQPEARSWWQEVAGVLSQRVFR